MKRLTLKSAAFATLLSLFAFSTPAGAAGRSYGGGYSGGGYHGSGSMNHGGGYYRGGGYHGYHTGYYGGHHHGGVYFSFGVPWPGYWWGGYYPGYYYGPPPYYGYSPYYGSSPYYDYAAPAMSAPPQYIERSDVEGTAPPAQQQPQQQQQPQSSQEPQQTWWYWCPSSEKYWPYVKECTGGFQRVPAQPPAPAR
jgi:hypothetical protein